MCFLALRRCHVPASRVAHSKTCPNWREYGTSVCVLVLVRESEHVDIFCWQDKPRHHLFCSVIAPLLKLAQLEKILPKCYGSLRVVLMIYNVGYWLISCLFRFYQGYEYSRSGNPTRNCLEQCLAKIEGAKHGESILTCCWAKNRILVIGLLLLQDCHCLTSNIRPSMIVDLYLYSNSSDEPFVQIYMLMVQFFRYVLIIWFGSYYKHHCTYRLTLFSSKLALCMGKIITLLNMGSSKL